MVTTEDEDEERYKRKTVAEAKRLFGKPAEPLAPPAKLARPSKPITVLFKPARDESPRWAKLPDCLHPSRFGMKIKEKNKLLNFIEDRSWNKSLKP